MAEEEEKKLIVLDADKKAVTDKCMKDLSFAMGNFVNYLNEGTLDEEFAATLLSNAQLNITQIAQRLEIPTESARESSLTRQLNQDRNERMAEMERDLASKSDVGSAIAKVKALFEETEKWWQQSGLGGWLDSPSVGKHGGMEFNLWVVLDKMNLGYSDNPVSERQSFERQMEKLQTDGWKLSKEGKREFALIDCDHNRQKMVALIRERFPGCIIRHWETRRTSREGDEFMINKVGVFFRDVGEHFE